MRVAVYNTSIRGPKPEAFAAEKGIKMVDQRKVQVDVSGVNANPKCSGGPRKAIRSEREALHRKQHAVLNGENKTAAGFDPSETKTSVVKRLSKGTDTSRQQAGLTDSEASRLAANKQVSRKRAEAAAAKRAERSGARSARRQNAMGAASSERGEGSPAKQFQRIAESGRMLRPGEFSSSTTTSPLKSGGHVWGEQSHK